MGVFIQFPMLDEDSSSTGAPAVLSCSIYRARGQLQELRSCLWKKCRRRSIRTLPHSLAEALSSPVRPPATESKFRGRQEIPRRTPCQSRRSVQPIYILSSRKLGIFLISALANLPLTPLPGETITVWP